MQETRYKPLLAVFAALFAVIGLLALPSGAAAYPTTQELCGEPQPTERYEECAANVEQGAKEEAEEQAEKRNHHQSTPGGQSAPEGRIPTVRKPTAIYVTGWYMRHAGSWTFRDSGSIDCNGGRLNRTRWRCRVWWRNGGRCFAGRVQVWGSYFLPGRGPFYYANGRFHGRYC